MARITVMEKVAPYVEQGLSVKEISEITGYCYNTVRYAVFPETRSKKKKQSTDDEKEPTSWHIGWNKDRKKCRTCQFRSRNKSVNGCDYIEHNNGRSRCCKVEDCDKYVRGKRLRINNRCGEDEEVFVEVGEVE